MAVEVKQASPRKRQNRFLVVLLICAAVLSAAKDLNRVIDLTSSAAGLVAYVHQHSFAPKAPAAPDCPQALAENDRSAQPYNWNGRIAPEQLAELNQSGGEIATVPAMNNELALAVIRKDLDLVPEAQRAVQCPTLAGRSNHLAPGGAVHIIDLPQTNNRSPRYLKPEIPAAVSIVERALNEQIDSALGKFARRSFRVYSGGFQIEGRRLYLRVPASAVEAPRPKVAMLSWVDEEESSESAATEVKVGKTTEPASTLDRLKKLRARIESDEMNDEAAMEPLMLRLLAPVTAPAAQPEAEESH